VSALWLRIVSLNRRTRADRILAFAIVINRRLNAHAQKMNESYEATEK
jgi:hypothetical protein